MAKFNLEFDTVEKTMSATLDGKKMKNLARIEFFGFGGDDFGMELTSFDFDEENKVSTMTRLMAGEEEAKDSTPKAITAEDIAKRLFPEN